MCNSRNFFRDEAQGVGADLCQREIYILQNALEDIANLCNCLGACDFADDPSCTARRALAKLMLEPQVRP